MFQKDSSGEYLQEILENNVVNLYKRRRVLGKGGFAKCYEVTDQQTNNRYACKVIDKELLSHSQLKEKLKTEIQIHRKMDHPNIVKFERVFQDQKYIYIILELCLNNTLNQLLKRRKVLSEVQVRFYMLQLLEGLKYLHKNKIVHRDLKLENFFLGDNLDIKIGDFGLAAEVSHKPRKTICGTPYYIAPQIFQSKNGYSYQVDVWSLGVTAYLLLYGHYPFENSDSRMIANRINSKTYLINPSLSDISKNFVSKMLQMKPHDRWTVKQLLQHQFFTYFEIPKILPRSSLACPLNSNFLDQFKCKKTTKFDLKEDQEFNFMLESRESHSSPRAKHSNYNQSMSASKIMKMSKQQNLPYIFSQKKLESFREGYPDQIKDSFKVKEWIMQWWQNPKYGLLYQSTGGIYGLRFNDGSTLKAHPYPFKFTYIKACGDVRKVTTSQVKGEKELASKLKIMTLMMEKIAWKKNQTEEEGVYIKMYANSLDIFCIWLSNAQLQAKFQDNSQFIIGRHGCMYINPHKIKIVFNFKDLEQQKQEIIQKHKRMSELMARIRKRGKQNIDPILN